MNNNTTTPKPLFDVTRARAKLIQHCTAQSWPGALREGPYLDIPLTLAKLTSPKLAERNHAKKEIRRMMDVGANYLKTGPATIPD